VETQLDNSSRIVESLPVLAEAHGERSPAYA
jgi:hypothetical protein